MPKLWSHIADLFSAQPVEADDHATQARVPDLQDAVEQARVDWLQARAFFDNVTEPDLVDYAIYYIEAAERKYMYLLKQARAQGLRLRFGVPEQQVLGDLPPLQHPQ